MDDRHADEPNTDAPGPTPEDIKTQPPANEEVDEHAVDQGLEKLNRTLPY